MRTGLDGLKELLPMIGRWRNGGDRATVAVDRQGGEGQKQRRPGLRAWSGWSAGPPRAATEEPLPSE